MPAGAGATVGWALLCAGGFVVYEAYRGVNPLTDLQAIISGKPRPEGTGGSWTGDTTVPLDPSAGGGGAWAPGTPGSDNATPYGGGNTPTAAGTRGTITSTAAQQVGKQYVWGGQGPKVFDCAGLVKYCYHAAGLYLPEGSGAQSLESVNLGGQANALPGDLVFYGHPADHVAVYLGGDQMIAADHPNAFGPGKGIGQEAVYPFNNTAGHPAAWYGRPRVLAAADAKSTTKAPRQVPQRTH